MPRPPARPLALSPDQKGCQRCNACAWATFPAAGHGAALAHRVRYPVSAGRRLHGAGRGRLVPRGFAWDAPLILALHQFSRPWLDTVMRVVTQAGQAGAIVVASTLAGWFLWRRRTLDAATVAISLVGATALNMAPKLSVALLRPPRPWWLKAVQLSQRSGRSYGFGCGLWPPGCFPVAAGSPRLGHRRRGVGARGGPAQPASTWACTIPVTPWARSPSPACGSGPLSPSGPGGIDVWTFTTYVEKTYRIGYNQCSR